MYLDSNFIYVCSPKIISCTIPYSQNSHRGAYFLTQISITILFFDRSDIFQTALIWYNFFDLNILYLSNDTVIRPFQHHSIKRNNYLSMLRALLTTYFCLTHFTIICCFTSIHLIVTRQQFTKIIFETKELYIVAVQFHKARYCTPMQLELQAERLKIRVSHFNMKLYYEKWKVFNNPRSSSSA